MSNNGSGHLPDKQAKNRGRWKPGQSGNPSGRPPKRISITSLVKEILEEVPDTVSPGVKNMGGKTWAELVAIALIKGAVEGNSAHVKELLERIEGKVTQPVRQEMSPELMAFIRDLKELEARVTEAQAIEGDVINGEVRVLPEPGGEEET